MPSSATITAFYTFVAGTRARASQVDVNFDNLRGHLVPTYNDTVAASSIIHDLGSSEHRWKNLYISGIDLNTSTSTCGLLFDGDTANTTGAFSFKIAGGVKGYIDGTGYLRKYLSPPNIVFSNSSGNVPGTGAAYADIGNLILSITVQRLTGGVVEVGLIDANATSQISMGPQTTTVLGFNTSIRIMRDLTQISETTLTDENNSTITSYPCAAFKTYDTGLVAGSYGYKVQAKVSDASKYQFTFANIKLYAREL